MGILLRRKHLESRVQAADTKATSVKLFKQLGWVPFYHEAKINKSILVYKRILGECPSHLTQMLIRNADVNGRTSRYGQLNFVCPRFKRESEVGRSFSVSTCRLWNIMPAHIKNQPNLTSFKNPFLNILWTVMRNWTILSCKFLIFLFSCFNC